jgi:deoxyadenosine/deoxycytidine kinase
MFAVEMSKTNNNIKHIAVAGNIGSGKTTLANLLSKHYGWEVQLEDMDDNPYITDFYDDMQRWSFNLQVYFLNIRFNNVKKIRSNDKTVIQDRTIYEDARIFAPNLHAMGLMSTRDYENYMALFESLNQMIPPTPEKYDQHLVKMQTEGIKKFFNKKEFSK